MKLHRQVKILLLYMGVAFLAIYAPLMMESFIKGSVDTSSYLFAALVLGPMAFLGLGLFLGEKILRFHVIIFILANALSLFVYSEPDMSPMLDLAHSFGGAYSLSFFVAWIVALHLWIVVFCCCVAFCLLCFCFAFCGCDCVFVVVCGVACAALLYFGSLF